MVVCSLQVDGVSYIQVKYLWQTVKRSCAVLPAYHGTGALVKATLGAARGAGHRLPQAFRSNTGAIAKDGEDDLLSGVRLSTGTDGDGVVAGVEAREHSGAQVEVAVSAIWSVGIVKLRDDPVIRECCRWSRAADFLLESTYCNKRQVSHCPGYSGGETSL